MNTWEKIQKKERKRNIAHTHTQLHTDKQKEPSSLQHLNLTLFPNILKARFEIKRPEVFLA